MGSEPQVQGVTSELRRWIAAQRAAGCATEELVAAMRASGWAEPVARAALTDAESRPVADAAPRAATALPEPDLAAGRNAVVLDDREVPVLMSLRQPRVLLFGDLLSHEECDALVAQARTRLVRSQTVDNRSGGSEVNAARTSDGMFFERGESALIRTIEQRIARLLRWPVDHGEGLQVLRYRHGTQYRPHYDYFDLDQPGTAAVLQRGGQRLATLIMYLCTPQRGGATVFPHLGLEVAPLKGHAVFFSYDRPSESTRTLHGGAPVEEGEKWVATKWLREGVFN